MEEENNSVGTLSATQNDRKKPFYKKWWVWSIIIVLLVAFVAVGFNWWKLVWSSTFRGDELEKANTALAAGVIISDPKDDFIILESNDEKVNPEKDSAYRLPELDLKSLQFGADSEYFYYKVTYFGKTTKTPPVINGDTLQSFGTNFDVTDQTGKITAVLHTDTGWWPVIHVPMNGSFYSTGPTGIEWPESSRFTTENRDSKVDGGAGTDYLLGRFPLKNLGLKYGETMYFDLEVEGGSDKYSHAAADAFLGTGKTSAMIKWIVGSKDYAINNNPDSYSSQQKTDDNSSSKTSGEIVDFESCAKNFPTMETYPETCKTSDGKTFTKEYKK